MKLSISEFAGTAPKIEPRRLAEKLATLSQNAGFESGALGPANIGTVPSTAFSGLSSAVRSILRPASGNDRLAFTSDTTGEAFASLVAPSDVWGRVYYTTALGPRFTVRENYTVGGLKINPVSYKLGIQTPLYQPSAGTPAFTVAVGETADTVRTAYVSTFVDKFGHEGAPSPASAITVLPFGLPFTCVVRFTAESVPDTNLTNAVRRIYRASYDGSSSEFQYIGEVPISAVEYIDTVALGEEGELLVSTNWVPPPAIKQMVPVASNFVAGFIDNIVCYSESRLPHAWPEEYRFPLKYQIVGLKPSQNGLLITTTGKPYWAFGVDPSSAVPMELDANHPCLSVKSMVDMGGYVIYASTDGLVAVTGQDVKIISSEFVDRYKWLRDFNPAGIVAFAYEERYIFSVGTQWWAFDPADGGAGFTTLTQLGVLPSELRQAYYDATRDVTVLLNSTGQARDVVAMEGTAYVWESKEFETPPLSFARARVLSTRYPVTLTVTVNGQATAYTIPGERPVPLKAGDSGTLWKLKVSGSGRITDVAIAQSPGEF
jgi:hypothetical protein